MNNNIFVTHNDNLIGSNPPKGLLCSAYQKINNQKRAKKQMKLSPAEKEELFLNHLEAFSAYKVCCNLQGGGGIGSANVCTFSKISLFKVLLQSGVFFLLSLRKQSKIKLFWTGFDMQGFQMRPITQG